jgi:N-carbamoylputrescine amidase
VGQEGNIKFWGGSLVINPFGTVLWEGDQQEAIQVIKVDLEQTNYYRNHWPFLRDRRMDSYQDIVKRFID